MIWVVSERSLNLNSTNYPEHVCHGNFFFILQERKMFTARPGIEPQTSGLGIRNIDTRPQGWLSWSYNTMKTFSFIANHHELQMKSTEQILHPWLLLLLLLLFYLIYFPVSSWNIIICIYKNLRCSETSQLW